MFAHECHRLTRTLLGKYCIQGGRFSRQHRSLHLCDTCRPEQPYILSKQGGRLSEIRQVCGLPVQLSQSPTPPHRYQDAERDTSSTLTIQKDNVKALFRRGQARVHLENFAGSRDGEMSSRLRVFPFPDDPMKICDEPSSWNLTIPPSKRSSERLKHSCLSIQNGPNPLVPRSPHQNHGPVASPLKSSTHLRPLILKTIS